VASFGERCADIRKEGKERSIAVFHHWLSIIGSDPALFRSHMEGNFCHVKHYLSVTKLQLSKEVDLYQSIYRLKNRRYDMTLGSPRDKPDALEKLPTLTC